MQPMLPCRPAKPSGVRGASSSSGTLHAEHGIPAAASPAQSRPGCSSHIQPTSWRSVHLINSIGATVAARTGRRESSRVQQPMAGRGEAPKPYAQGSAETNRVRMGSISAVHNSFFKIKSSIAQNPTAQNSGLCPLSTAGAPIRRYVQLFSADVGLRAIAYWRPPLRNPRLIGQIFISVGREGPLSPIARGHDLERRINALI
jgi:hypothetical protein